MARVRRPRGWSVVRGGRQEVIHNGVANGAASGQVIHNGGAVAAGGGQVIHMPGEEVEEASLSYAPGESYPQHDPGHDHEHEHEHDREAPRSAQMFVEDPVAFWGAGAYSCARAALVGLPGGFGGLNAFLQEHDLADVVGAVAHVELVIDEQPGLVRNPAGLVRHIVGEWESGRQRRWWQVE